MNKLEEVLRICSEIEFDLERHRLSDAESKFLTLCGVLAKGTKYKGDINRIADLYLQEWQNSLIK